MQLKQEQCFSALKFTSSHLLYIHTHWNLVFQTIRWLAAPRCMKDQRAWLLSHGLRDQAVWSRRPWRPFLSLRVAILIHLAMHTMMLASIGITQGESHMPAVWQLLAMCFTEALLHVFSARLFYWRIHCIHNMPQQIWYTKIKIHVLNKISRPISKY